MSFDESNQQQAEFWAAAGPLWVRQRERFDRQAGAHGLAAIEVLAPADGEQIVDVGCGAGSTAIEIARRVGPNGSVLGVDISASMIDGARALSATLGTANVEFVVDDAMAMDFDASADGVFSRFGVMFFSDATTGFANLRGALRVGGRLGFTCWRSAAENPWISESFALVGKYTDLPFAADPTAPGPMSLADPDRIGSVLAAAGFGEVEVVAHDAPARLGDDPAEAVDFLSELMPMVDALRRDDPVSAGRLHDELHEMVVQWTTADGVEAPSATWIVSAATN